MARLLVAGLIAAAAATTPLIAQAVAPQPMTMGMAKTTTRADVQLRTQAQFAKRDANRDGFLTSDEIGRGGQREGRMGKRGMQHGEGRRDGAMRDPAVAFDRIDANRDGSISRDEFARGRELRVEKRVMVNQGEPGAAGMEQRRNGRMGGMNRGGRAGGAMLKMADANRDGKVTLAEATAGALANFDRLDTNRDGRLTPEERAAGRAQMKAMRQAG